jgi:hypothetical protein
MKEALSLPKHAKSLEICAVNKDNVLYLINILGEDKAKGKLKFGAPYFEYEVKEDVQVVTVNVRYWQIIKLYYWYILFRYTRYNRWNQRKYCF